jgi:exopolyphosphatase / guanosine-5'-triphosphate,3'-diphosphate pyrophosphatase
MSPTSYQTAPPRVALYVVAKIERPAKRRKRLGGSGIPLVAGGRRRLRASSIRRMRVAVVDIGSNSTRLLVAEVDQDTGSLQELARDSRVTRLGEGVDASGSLAEAAIERVANVLADYRGTIEEHDCEANLAVLTSAVRDADNGADFAERVREEYGLDARVLSGDEEAQLTFVGAMSTGPEDDGPTGGQGTGNDDGDTGAVPTVVIDIGGGSTEFVIGSGRTADFHVSLHVGVVRMSERHIHSDPPEPHELQKLAADVRRNFEDGLPGAERDAVKRAIAVAGTATSAASIEQELDPYDSERVNGYALTLGTVEMLLARLADMDEAGRREVVGLHPDRAPTIVAGMIVLGEALRAFDLEHVEVSEHDILHGGALRLAGVG